MTISVHILHKSSPHSLDPQGFTAARRSEDEEIVRDRGLVWFQGLTSVAGSGPAGVVTAGGCDSVENQEDIADLALVNAPPTD